MTARRVKIETEERWVDKYPDKFCETIYDDLWDGYEESGYRIVNIEETGTEDITCQYVKVLVNFTKK